MCKSLPSNQNSLEPLPVELLNLSILVVLARVMKD